MILVYVPRMTNRLGYTLNVTFKKLLHTDYLITTSTQTFLDHQGPRLSYGDHRLTDEPHIANYPLLFETSIKEQDVHCSSFQDTVTLFATDADSDLPYDIFAAVFYMISRYEEYLPFKADEHGRFCAKESLAYRQGFLMQAVVDRWALHLRDLLLKHFPTLILPTHNAEMRVNVDVDAAYCYRHKGVLRTIRGILLDLLIRRNLAAFKRRIQVLRGRESDPYDTFDYIIDVTKRYPAIKTNFFILLGDYSDYDKPIDHTNRSFRQLLQHLNDYTKMGIHLSYYSTENPAMMAREVQRLSDILHRSIVRNRFHFLRFRMPQAYHNLIELGILHDYSMGFADEPGYRCGTCTPYPFFDLSTNQELALTIHPFAVMDATLNTHKHLTVEEAKAVYQQVADETIRNGASLITLWHNQNLSEEFGWQGWRSVFEMMAEISQREKNAPLSSVAETKQEEDEQMEV